MAIVRTYLCESCGTKFDKLHFDRSEPAPECPGCQALDSKQAPSGFAIGGSNTSRAVDLTQSILEKDYGLSNFKDNLRAGETAAPTLAPSLQPVAQKFWKPSGDIIAAARQGAAISKAEGKNPLTMIQRVSKSRGPSAAKVLCQPVNRNR